MQIVTVLSIEEPLATVAVVTQTLHCTPAASLHAPPGRPSFQHQEICTLSSVPSPDSPRRHPGETSRGGGKTVIHPAGACRADSLVWAVKPEQWAKRKHRDTGGKKGIVSGSSLCLWQETTAVDKDTRRPFKSSKHI
uniref:Uncharacterized protein n=1 Tax=Knipowitschia caucasica TaxID=637954 RepID=A0AAV2MQG8_KNICA